MLAPVEYRRRRSAPLIAGAVIVSLFVVAAVAAPVICGHDPIQQDLLNGLAPPSAEHFLGTDQLGRDVLSRIVYAARTDLRVGLAAVVLPAVSGTALGLTAGYFGGLLDRAVAYAVDVNLSFPFYVIALALVGVLGSSETAIYVTFALVAWVNYARVVSAVTAGFARDNWVAAARAGGLSQLRVIVRHILPNAVGQIVVILVNDIVFVILAIVTLSYLGLGIQPPTPNWGGMIADGQAFLSTKPWLVLFPGAAVMTVGIGFSLLADGFADLVGTDR
jgi:peptide/nickel transport system permease protein